MDKSENVVIDVKNVKKKFRIYYDRSATLKERILFQKRREYEDHWVLKGISFQVQKGEAIGLIGENGCGKSTTLKMLTKILYPDAGSIQMKGRVSSLIELGAGFHPDMSGLENIYTNASIFGLKRDEIDRRLQEIIDFSELGAYIDNPVRTYSSGMYTRLAFAVAINVDADILLVDEILAVGDAAFQAKCFRKMQEIKANGITIVIVSHSLGQIEQICDKSIWIDQGRIRMEGRPMDVHPFYLEYMGAKNKTLDAAPEPEAPAGSTEEPGEAAPESDNSDSTDSMRWGSREIEIKTVKLQNSEDTESSTFKTGEKVKISISYRCKTQEIRTSVIGLGIFRLDGVQCYGSNTLIDRIGSSTLNEQGTVTIDIPKMDLLPGAYSLDIAFHKEDGFSYDYWRGCVQFQVYSDRQDVGVARLDHSWEIR